jgi:hypothetical protein
MAEQLDKPMSAAAVARHLHRDRRTIAKWTQKGLLPVWFIDDNGKPVYSLHTIEAHQRRSGELAAERRAS